MPKHSRGMGFKNLHYCNVALLAKQIWRLRNNPNSLLLKLLNIRYYLNGSIIEARIGRNTSYSWHRIAEARWVIERGAKWKVGNGEKIKKIWKSNWLPAQNGGKPWSSLNILNVEAVVIDLIDNQQKMLEGKLDKRDFYAL